jgi:hypothetical protein
VAGDLPRRRAVHRAAAALEVKLIWGAVWDRALLTPPGSRAGLEGAVAGYVARRRALGRRAFIDAPHYELYQVSEALTQKGGFPDAGVI